MCTAVTEGNVHCSVYVQGSLVKTVDCKDIEGIKNLLLEMDTMIPRDGFEMVPLVSNVQTKTPHKVYADKLHSLKCCGIAKSENRCLQCKYLRKLLLNQASYRRTRVKQARTDLSRNLVRKNAQLRRQRRNIAKMSERIEKMKQDNEAVSSAQFEERLEGLTRKQQLQVRSCFEASTRKATNGMKFDKEWILECILMHIKSPRLYEHIRAHKLMVVPSPSCLKKYIRSYKSGFGFSERVLMAVAEKTKAMDPYHRHGGILVDEIKLSVNLAVNSKGPIDGFVDLGAHSTEEQQGVACDHGLVAMFQPLTGKWQQILGVFGARGNVKATVLSKNILDGVICAEKSDGAAWNRSMWNIFGISGKLNKTVCKIKHPVDPSRELPFILDFPHLVKLDNFKRSPTPDGRVGSEYVREAWKCDTASTVTFRAMPHVTTSVFQPNVLEKNDR